MPGGNKKFCCNPFLIHKKKIFHNVFPINSDIEAMAHGKLKEKDFLCVNCKIRIQKAFEDQAQLKKLPSFAENIESEESSSESIEITSNTGSSDTNIEVSELNIVEDILPFLDESPLKTAGLSFSQKQIYGFRKLRSSSEKIKRSLETAFGIDLPVPDESKIPKTSENNLQKFENMMKQLVEKFRTTKDHKLKLQILTLSPFTIKKTSEYFATTIYMVQKSRKLRTEFGILPEIPNMSKGKVITNDMKDKVRDFYESEDLSRQCPGVKDYKTCTNEEGQKVKMQKRLMLSNLKELFEAFVKTVDEGLKYIGFSSFASLRPPWCILAGSSGTHSVCVCTYHQNPKLQIASLGIKDLNYKTLLETSVCQIENEECMMQKCNYCPRELGVHDYLTQLKFKNDSIPDEICYKQWVTVDRCTIIEKKENYDEYITSLSKSISTLTRHHFVSKSQAKYFKNLKDTLPDNEGCLVGDFAENYSFIVQDAAQGFHWENSQCTVHPFVFYWRKDDKVHHQSYCFISDCLKHNTITVYAFQTKLIPMICGIHKDLTKIHYFSDGCGGQYKNKFNFLNLCHHKEDFGIEAEWNFFATSHGKNACDGIGGNVKRATAKASLLRNVNNQILTAKDMFNFCSTMNSVTKFIFISEIEIKEIENCKLKERMKIPLKPVTGTRKLHRFIPESKETMKVFYLSHGVGETRNISGTGKHMTKQSNTSSRDIKIGNFIGCRYDNQLWFGLVEGYDAEYEDYTIKFLKEQGINPAFTFPTLDDICPVAKEDILGIVEASLRGGSRIQYTFPTLDMQELLETL